MTRYVKRVTTTHHGILQPNGKPVVRLHEPPGCFLPLENWRWGVERLGYQKARAAGDPNTAWSQYYWNPETNTTKKVEWFEAD